MLTELKAVVWDYFKQYLQYGLVGRIVGFGVDVAERKQSEEWLRKARDELEMRVRERTAELARANEELRNEIAERQRAEEARRKSEERFRNLIETTSDLVWEVDESFVYTYVSPRIRDLLGYQPEEVLGKTPFALMPQEEARRVGDTLGLVALRRQAFRGLEVTNWHRDGHLVVLESSGVPFFDVDGTFRGYRGIDRDITERKQAEDLFRTLSSSSPIGICIAQGGRFQFANRQFQKQTGFTEDELLGMDSLALVLPEDKEMVRKNAIAMLKGERSSPIEYRAFTRAGEIRWIMENVASIQYKGRRAVLGSFMDVTEHKKVEESLKQSLEKLQKTMKSTIEAMALTSELRDPYTAGHQRRVAQVATAIATEMGLSGERIDGINLAALIHDIGKICVPAEILSKPGRISEIEFSLIQAHPQVGFDILKRIEFPWPIAQVVLQHHEKMDGSGYPSGLSGEDILLEARILCVADVVEAIASYRPYRPALGEEIALQEILQNSGILYDPRVVDACLKVFNERGFMFE